MAIYDEVIKIGDKIQGDDFIALYNFIDLLATVSINYRILSYIKLNKFF